MDKKILTIMFYECIWMELTYLMVSSSFINILRTLELYPSVHYIPELQFHILTAYSSTT